MLAVFRLLTTSVAEMLKELPVLSPNRICWSLNSLSLVVVVPIVIVSGSSKSVPVSPLGAVKVVEPWYSRSFFPETSAKPPSPLRAPPVAVIEPAKEVDSSAQTMILPPLPWVVALATRFVDEDTLV